MRGASQRRLENMYGCLPVERRTSALSSSLAEASPKTRRLSRRNLHDEKEKT